MSSPKDIRKQVRNVTKEVLSDVLTQELMASIRKELTAQMDQRLNAIAKHIQSTLDQLDQRSKDMQAYMIRNSAPTAPIKQD